MEQTCILLLSKERPVLDLLRSCGDADGWQVETASSGWEALERVHAGPGPDLVLVDMSDGDCDALHALRWLRRVRPDLAMLVLADSHDPHQKTEAIRLGAQDFPRRRRDDGLPDDRLGIPALAREDPGDPPPVTVDFEIGA